MFLIVTKFLYRFQCLRVYLHAQFSEKAMVSTNNVHHSINFKIGGL